LSGSFLQTDKRRRCCILDGGKGFEQAEGAVIEDNRIHRTQVVNATMKILVIENQKDRSQDPWWMRYVGPCSKRKGVTVHALAISDKLSAGNLSAIWGVLALVVSGRRYDWILTPQDGLATMGFGIARRFVPFRRPRHAVLEFITREEGTTLHDRFKYALLRCALHSVDRLICSSRGEVEYYREHLRMRRDQVRFAPLGGDPSWTARSAPGPQDYILSAGRTLRDYGTLMRAIEGTGYRLVVVTSPHCLTGLSIPSGVEVQLDIEASSLLQLIQGARFVVLPLQDRKISCGQRLLLMAMAQGKCCVVSRVPGMIDYVTDGVDGVLVPPRDPDAMRAAIRDLWPDQARLDAMGSQAQAAFEARYRIEHHAESVLSLLISDGGAVSTRNSREGNGRAGQLRPRRSLDRKRDF